MDRVKFLQTVAAKGNSVDPCLIFDQLMWVWLFMPTDTSYVVKTKAVDGDRINMTVSFKNSEISNTVCSRIRSVAANGPLAIYGHQFHLYGVSTYDKDIRISFGL